MSFLEFLDRIRHLQLLVYVFARFPFQRVNGAKDGSRVFPPCLDGIERELDQAPELTEALQLVPQLGERRCGVSFSTGAWPLQPNRRIARA